MPKTRIKYRLSRLFRHWSLMNKLVLCVSEFRDYKTNGGKGQHRLALQCLCWPFLRALMDHGVKRDIFFRGRGVGSKYSDDLSTHREQHISENVRIYDLLILYVFRAISCCSAVILPTYTYLFQLLRLISFTFTPLFSFSNIIVIV